MQGKLLNGYPFRVDTNVNARVVGSNKKLKQDIHKHNMATANLTEGVVKFLRGEFTESYISGLIPNIGNDFNVADQYIPAYMGMGVAGVSYSPDSTELKLTTGSGFAPSYADTKLISEIMPLANPGRAPVTKSIRGNASLSQAASLIISATYHFENQAETQVFSLQPSYEPLKRGSKLYLTDSLYPGRNLTQRIKSLTPTTAGWRYRETLPLSETDSTRGTGIIYYTTLTQAASNEATAEFIDVFSIDLNTGILTVLPAQFTLTAPLDIAYDPVNFDFIYADGSNATVPFIREGLEHTYYISELGLFSGDISNDNSKLLARVMLDNDTPLKISEGDYVVITWQIGVYALDDALYVDDVETELGEESSSLKFITQEEQTTLVWDEITEVDEDGNIKEKEIAPVSYACYNIRALDVSNLTKNNTIDIHLDSADGMRVGFYAAFNCIGIDNISGSILAITHKDVETYEGEIDSYDIVTISVGNPEAYSSTPIQYYANQLVFNVPVECHQVLEDVVGTLPDYTYTYTISDITVYDEDTPKYKASASIPGMTKSAINSTKCIFNPIYYLFGSSDTSFIQNPESSMYYTLGSISDLFGLGAGNIDYSYSIRQVIPADASQRPIIFDTSEFILDVRLAVEPKTNQRSVMTMLYKVNNGNKQYVDKIIFNNKYNPIVQEGSTQ